MLDMTSAKQAIKDRLKLKKSSSNMPVDYEVLIIGAGLAGVGMACRLQQRQHKNLFGRKGAYKATRNQSPKKKTAQRFVILEKRADLGGTWDLFTYPGGSL